MNLDIETQLRAQRWRDPPPEFLEEVLRVALEESRQRPGVRRPSGAFGSLQACAKLQRAGALQDAAAPKNRPWPLALLAFIPRALRLPLAACWLLALFFHLTTPVAVPQSTLDDLARLPAPIPEEILAHLEQAERLAHELLEQLRGPLPPL
ncbi:MAG: hypothetical protein ACO1TE_18040 [Prosthecobacter sp.]